MAGIGFGELLLVLIICLIVFPAEDVVKFSYNLGKYIRKLRNLC